MSSRTLSLALDRSRWSRLRRVGLWKEVPWRLKARLDRSGVVESALLEEIEWTRRVAREPRVFSGDGCRPLRILLLTMRFDYGSFKRGLSYEETHFAETLKEWGYEVVQLDFVALARKFGKGRMNEMVRECAVRVHPDVAFCVLFRDEMEPDSIDFLRRQGIVTINWFCDDQWRYESFSRFWAPHFDLVTTTSEDAFLRYVADGHTNVLKTQWGFNPYIFHNYGSSPRAKDVDIAFVGQPHGNRREVVGRLARAGLDVRVHGYGWPQGRLSYGEMLDLYSRSSIVLGLSNDSAGEKLQIKGRDFEVPAAGACHVTSCHPELAQYFEIGQEVVCYRDTDELIGLCRELLASRYHEEIGRAGRERAWRDHTYVRRFEDIFAAAGFREIEAPEHLCV